MRKISRALSALHLIIKRPWLLNLVLDDENYWKKKVNQEFGFSSGLPVIDLTTLFGDDFHETVNPMALLDGGSTPADLALLKSLARKFKARNYFEIGTWRGESVANVATVVPDCYTLNLPDDTMRQMQLPEDYIKMHRFFSEGNPNIKHLQADSHEFDFRSLPHKFDLVFVDGDHHSDAVAADTRRVFNIREPEKGIIVWHDYASNPEKIRWSVLYGILKGCPPELHHRLFHVSNTLCAVFLPEAAGSFFSTFLKANSQPQKHFEISLKVTKKEDKNFQNL